jgi:hypothetical protein
LKKSEAKVIGSIFCKVKRRVGFCVFGVCLTKNEHPKGFGALEDCPNKKSAKLIAAAGFTLA